MQRSHFWSLSALRMYAVTAAFVIGVFGFAAQSHAVVRTWDGGGVTNNWSEDANWSSDTEPGASDVATFDATSTKAATIDASISVSGIDVNTGYSGTITQASGVTVTVGTGDFDLSAGTFTGGDSTIDINDAFTISGGTFNATTGTMTVATAFTISSGTFNELTGTVTADGGANATWNIATTETFYNLTINKSGTTTITSGDTLVVTGTLTLTEGLINTGTIDARDDISQAATFDGGTATVEFGDDGVVQTYTINGGVTSFIELDSAADASDSIVFAADATVEFINITSGFSGTIPISNAGGYVPTFKTWTQAAGTYDASAQASWKFTDFNITGGSFIAPTLVTFSGNFGATWDVQTTHTFNNFTMVANENLAMASNESLIVTGTLTLTNGAFNTGTIDVRGNVSQASTFSGGTGTISFGDDGVAQTYTINGGIAPTIKLDSASDASDTITFSALATVTHLNVTSGFSGTIPISNAGDYVLTFTTWTQAAGTYDASAQASWKFTDFNITGGSFTAPTLVTFSGIFTGVWDVQTTQTFNNLTLNANEILATASNESLIVTGTLTLTLGLFNTGTIDTRGNISQASTFGGGTGIIDFGDDSVAQTYTINGGVAPTIELDSASDANDSITFSTASRVTHFSITSGFSGAIPIVNSGNSALTMTTWTQVAGTYDASAQSSWTFSDFNITGGSFTAPTTVTKNAGNQTWDVSTSQTFQNLTINAPTDTLTVNTGDSLIVTGTLTLTDGSLSSTGGGLINAQGDVTVATTWDTGSLGILEFGGSATQTFTITGGTGLFNGDINVNKTGGQVNLATALIMDAASQDLNIIEGKLNLAGNNLTVNGTSGTFVVQDGGNFQLRGSETITLNATYPTLSTGSTVTYTGDGDSASDTYTVTTLKSTYHHLVINSTDGATDTFQLGAALDVNGNLTVTAGTFDVSASNYAITLAGNWSNGGTFNPRNGTVTLDADTGHTFTGATTWYNLTLQNTTNTTTSITLTLPATVTQTIGGALTLDGFDGNDLILLVSSSGGSVATIDFTGSSTFTGDYLQVTDITATDNSSGVSLPLNPSNSTDGGNTTGWFSVSVTFGGTVYTDEGVTNIGTGKTVRLLQNGVDTTITGDTDASGNYSLDATALTLVAGDVLTLYLDDETENAVAVTRYDTGSVSGIDLYKNYVVIRHEDAGPVSNTDLDTADNADPGSSTDDISSIYSVSAGNLSTASSSIELLVSTGDTYTPGGNVDANGNLDINGTLSAGTNSVNVAGSLDNAGTWTHTGTLTMDGTASQAMISGGATFGSDVVIANTSAVVSLSGNAFNIGANDLTINTGAIFSLAGQNLTASGTFSNNGTLRLQGGETVTLTQDTNSGTFAYLGDGDTAVDTFTMSDFGVTDYYNLTISTTDSGDVIQLGAAKSIAGALSVTSGTYSANANTTSVTGLTTVSGGTYTASTATQTLTGLTVSGGTFTGSSGTVDVNGTVTLSSGTLTAPSGSMTVQGNWTHSAGTFAHNSGTVTLDANANHSISGNNGWYNLTLQDTSDNATDVVLTITASTTQTVSGTLTWDGLDASDRLNVVSSSGGTAAVTSFSGSSTFSGDYLDLLDNTVTDNSTGVSIPINPANTVNSGNTNGWFVTTISGAVFVNESINGIGAGITVRLLQNGADTGVTAETDASSTYELDISSLSVNTGDILTLYLDDETANGVVVTSYDLVVLTDVEIYQNFLVIRSEDGSAITNTNLDTADNADPGASSDDISSIYSVSGGTLTTGSSIELWIHTGDTFTPGGAVDANGNLEVSAASATFNAEANAVSVAATIENNGTWTHTGTLTLDGTGAQLLGAGSSTLGCDVVIANTSSTVTLTGTNLDIGANDLTINSGATLVLANRNLTATGTFSNSGTLRLRGTETVTVTQDTNSGTFELLGDAGNDADTFTLTDFGATDYYNLTISTTDSGDIFQAGTTAPKSIAGALTITSGTYDANANTTSVTGLTTVSGGTYTASTATQTLTGLTVSGGTFTGSSGAVDVNGTLTISSGTFTAPSGSLTISGNFTHSSGTFTHNSGSVVFDADTDHAITGDNTWNNLTLQDTSDNATDVVLTVAASSTQTIDGTLTLDGLDASDRLNLVSSAASTAATTAFAGSSTFSGDYLDITDNTVTDNSSGVSLPITPANSVDGGNTNGWFSTYGVTVSAISGNTTEAGGTATFTVVLTAQPSGDVVVTSASNDSTEGTVTTGSSLTFTTGNWATPQTVTVTGANDDLDDGDVAYSIQVDTDDASTADGNYDSIDPDDVSVTNTDNDTAGVTVSAISGNTTEAGGTATFTVVLNAQPTGNVQVDSATSDSSEGTVTSGGALTFTTANWATPQTVTVTGANDDLDDDDVAYSIQTSTNDAATADNAYDSIDPDDVSVTNTDNDTVGVTVSAISQHTTEAGQTATFTVVLNTEPTGDVEIDSVSGDSSEGTVTGGGTLTFTTANWDTPQTVTVTGQDDALIDGNITYSIQVDTDDTNTADNTYDAVDPDDVSVINDDDEAAGITVSAISGNTTEAGGTATFTVVLTTQPAGNVQVDSVSSDSTEGTVSSGGSLTFTTVNWATPQTVTVTGANDDLDDGDVAYSIQTSTNDTATADDNYDAVDPDDVSVTNTDNDTAGITVSAISGNTTEAGGTATFTVVLNAQPTGNVQVDSTTSDSTEGTVTTGGELTFTTANWATPQTVTITGANDDLDDGDIAYTIQTVTNDTNSLDDVYDAINPDDVSVTNTDNDTAGASLVESASDTAVDEAGPTSDDFTLVLTSQPSASVTVSLSYDSDITSATSSLTFTTGNWNTPQSVTVTAVDDEVDETSPHAGLVTFSFSSSDLAYDNLSFSNLSVDVTDNDSSDITVSAISGSTTEAGGTATFTVVLNTLPSADVTMEISSNDTTEGTVSSSSLTFTTGNWNTPQTVTVTGVNDNIDDGDVQYAVVVGTVSSADVLYNGLNPADVDVTNTDNDTAGITVTESSGSTSVDELGATSDTYTVVLTSEPTANVSVGFTYDTNDLSLDAASITFTSLNWNVAQTVTVTAVDDADDESSPHAISITHAVTSDDSTYNNFSVSNVTVSILDNDTSASSGGSSIVNTYVTSASVEVTNVQTVCEVSNYVTLLAKARGAARVVVSNDPDFLTETAYEFVPDESYSSEEIDGMAIPWTLAGNEGDQAVYTIFISSTNNRTAVIPTVVPLGTCIPAEPDDSTGEPTDDSSEEPGTPTTGPAFLSGVSPFDGVTLETVDVMSDGDIFRGHHYATVYMLDDGKRRPYIDEQTFFSWHDDFEEVRVVTDVTLSAYSIGSPILPQPGKVLVKIDSSPTVYVTEEPNILRSIASESDAELLLGPAWNLFVISLPPTVFKQYVIGTPFKVTIPWNIRYFFTRPGLQANDLDRDGLTNEMEEQLGTDPEDLDTDGDALPDYTEIQRGTDPLSRD